MSRPTPCIRRLRLGNYRSIASCDATLGPFTVLVGPNGSGKSNFLDALALVADALDGSLRNALRDRGGLRAIRHLGEHGAGPVEIAVELQLTAASTGRYEIVLEESPEGGDFRVLRESGVLACDAPSVPEVRYRVEAGEVVEWKTGDGSIPPAVSADHLYLVRASSAPEFQALHDVLSRMRIYRFDAEVFLHPTPTDSGDFLVSDASNLASVVRQLREGSPETLEHIEVYLQAVLPSLRRVDAVSAGSFETLELVMEVSGREHRFPTASVSDGTLRALATLTAALQPTAHLGPMPVVVGLEEPEKAIHPAATAALADAFFEASKSFQVIVTTHSPDLLDHETIEARDVLAVVAEDGITRIGGLDESSLSVLGNGLSTLGELLRQQLLDPA